MGTGREPQVILTFVEWETALGSNTVVSDGSHAPKLGITIKWSTISLTLAGIAFASVTVLIIIVTTTSADLLATVALLLAILSFSAQLIVTASQAHSADLHYRDLSELSTHTQGTLEKLDERLNGMLESQKNTFEKLLNTVIDNGVNQETIEHVLATVKSSIVNSDTKTPGNENDVTATFAEVAEQLTAQLRSELKQSVDREVEQASLRAPVITMRRTLKSKIMSEEQRAIEGLSRLMVADKNLVAKFIERGHEMDTRGGRIIKAEYAKLPKWVTDLGPTRLVRISSGTNTDTSEKFTQAALTQMGQSTLDALSSPEPLVDDHLSLLVSRVRRYAQEG
ncbi:hypothetical protein ACXR2W_00865 [Leucobacter sp. HY1908]